MKNEHAGAIKGLSIAVVVLSAIGIIGAILIMVFSGLLSAVLLENGPEIAYHLEFNDNGTITGGGTAFDSEDAFFLSMLMMLVGGGVAIWALICCIVALIAGIFGIMHAANPPKLGFVMGWAIAGAVTSFLGAGLITMVLLIIVAVFANADKRAYRCGTTAAASQQPPCLPSRRGGTRARQLDANSPNPVLLSHGEGHVKTRWAPWMPIWLMIVK